MVKIFDAPLDEKKVGATYKKLPAAFQNSIRTNLQISPTMKSDIESGRKNKITDEWKTGIPGSKTKMKIIMDVSSDGALTYTAKIRNKIIKRTTSKESMANTVAMFYMEELKKRR